MIPTALALALVIGGGYVAYQRVGTRANADYIEFAGNYGGGFLAVGMTATQPGFVVLSMLDRDAVAVTANQYRNRLAGTHTIVTVKTPKSQWSARLRRPQIVLVHANGSVENHAVHWSYEDFRMIRDGTDCIHTGSRANRCPWPFADLRSLFAGEPADRVPPAVQRFVRPFGGDSG